MKLQRIVSGLLLSALWLSCSRVTEGAFIPVPLGPTAAQTAATFSQASFPASSAINGLILAPGLIDGWAIDPNEVAQTAVFESVSDFGLGATILRFTLTQNFGGGHNIGQFRLSVTTDARTTFADGLQTGGDVTAPTWTVLTPLTQVSTGGATLSHVGGGAILASGPNPDVAVYTVTAFTSLVGIKGVRLEVIEDVSLPGSGPGRQISNGNFVLSELQLEQEAQVSQVIPEPATLCIWAGFGLAAAGGAWRRRRMKSA